MKADELDKAITKKFVEEGAPRLVFWDDPNGEFTDYVQSNLPNELSDVTVLDLAKEGGLATKLKLEREDTQGRYLLYRTGARPPAEEDWLLDIRLYSAEFHADVASIWLQELGLTSLSLRDHLRAREKFLGSQERRKKLARLLAADDTQEAIDLKMITVLVGSDVANPFSILRALCHGHLSDGHFDLSTAPKAVAQIEKMALADHFWQLMQGEFGYQEDTPNVAGLLRRLFVSELLKQLGNASISALAHFALPSAGAQNAAVCLTQWRDSAGKAASYDAVAEALAADLSIKDHLRDIPLESLSEVFCFFTAERPVVSKLKNRVLDESQTIDPAAIEEVATHRKAGHWLAGPGKDTPEREALAKAYDAIVAAAKLFALRNTHQRGFSFDDAAAVLNAYQEELYLFDQHYRHFFEYARPAIAQGWDLLKTIADEVERVYDQAFLVPLGLEWGRFLDDGFLSQWQAEGMQPQQRFYKDVIQPYLSESDRKRAYVIISDAFRYEAAQELTEALNGQFRMDAALETMLGVVPSYTTLGMASLLPHETLSYNDKGDVLVDGHSTAGTAARDKQLSRFEGMACQAKDLRGMKNEEAREYTKGKRVVYIYHNVVDARGDTASTESETFDAVAKCIAELVDLIKLCINKLGAIKVWVTADHGFLFQQEAPTLTDKSKLSRKPENAMVEKKRYVVGNELGVVAEAHCGSTRHTASTESDTQFWIPRGTNRFHFAGGARFVHGGAMPQEVVVPLVTIKQLKGEKAKQSRVDKVKVQVLGTRHKITTPTHRFKLIQTEPVSERRQPLTVKAAVYDAERPVTSVDTVTFDSASGNMDEREKYIRVELQTGEFDKSKPYRLILRDVDTDTEVLSVSVIIDRSFDDDF